MTNTEKTLQAMTAYYGDDIQRVNHFLKVYGYAKLIAAVEGMDTHEQEVIELAALTHDIGIKESEQRYGDASGKHQEELGPPIARKMLGELHIPQADIERICYLIAHHHTYTNIDATDYRILVEADFLVNIDEGHMHTDAVRRIDEKIFRTQEGRRLLRAFYLDAAMTIRPATEADLEAIANLEAACFPPLEAATKEAFHERLRVYPDHFRLLLDGERLIGFVNGMATDQRDLSDEMYENAHLHHENGRWQMIFGVNTLPQYRECGYAGTLIRQVIADAKAQGRNGVVLTCKEQLLHFYASFGFVDEGISASVHGNTTWHQMRLVFGE